MKEATQDLCLQYALRRTDVLAIVRHYEDALDEDYVKNADMFDVTRTTFSQSKHPNATMRALEKDLLESDLPLLCLLAALTDLGMELTQGLCHFSTPLDFADAVGERYAQLMRATPSAPLLAQHLTEIKAEHALKRLKSAVCMMDSCTNCS